MTRYKDKWCQEAYNKGFKEGQDFEKGQFIKAKNLLQKVVDTCGYPNYNIPIELYADIASFLKNDGCLDVMCEDCTKEDCEVRQLGLVEVEK